MIAISLLFSFLIPMGIHLGVLHWQQHLLKRSIKFEYLRLAENRHLLTSFTCTKQEYEQLDWEEPHEFKKGAEKYDVIELLTKGDVYEVWCFRDRDEEALEQEIERCILAFMGHPSSQRPLKKDGKKEIAKELAQLLTVSISEIDLPRPQSFLYTKVFYKLPTQSMEVPPPQIRF